MTTGEPVVVRCALKPLPTLTKPLRSVDIATREPAQALRERTDSAVVPAAGVVGEAMLAIVLASACREKFGGDHIDDVRAAMDAYDAHRLGARRWPAGRLVFIGFMGAARRAAARAGRGRAGARAVDSTTCSSSAWAVDRGVLRHHGERRSAPPRRRSCARCSSGRPGRRLAGRRRGRPRSAASSAATPSCSTSTRRRRGGRAAAAGRCARPPRFAAMLAERGRCMTRSPTPSCRTPARGRAPRGAGLRGSATRRPARGCCGRPRVGRVPVYVGDGLISSGFRGRRGRRRFVDRRDSRRALRRRGRRACAADHAGGPARPGHRGGAARAAEAGPRPRRT